MSNRVLDAMPFPSSRTINLRLYPWYAAVFIAHIWMLMLFLYFLRHMELAAVLCYAMESFKRAPLICPHW